MTYIVCHSNKRLFIVQNLLNLTKKCNFVSKNKQSVKKNRLMTIKVKNIGSRKKCKKYLG